VTDLKAPRGCDCAPGSSRRDFPRSQGYAALPTFPRKRPAQLRAALSSVGGPRLTRRPIRADDVPFDAEQSGPGTRYRR
jgi:hypothetical protein